MWYSFPLYIAGKESVGWAGILAEARSATPKCPEPPRLCQENGGGPCDLDNRTHLKKPKSRVEFSYYYSQTVLLS